MQHRQGRCPEGACEILSALGSGSPGTDVPFGPRCGRCWPCPRQEPALFSWPGYAPSSPGTGQEGGGRLSPRGPRLRAPTRHAAGVAEQPGGEHPALRETSRLLPGP